MENVNTNINIMNMYQQKNPDIFSDINMIEPNEQHQKKDYGLIQNNEDRYKTKLTLRKKKLQEKLSEKRNIDYSSHGTSNNESKFHIQDFIFLNGSFIDLLTQIPLDNKDEEKIKSLLRKIYSIIQERVNNYNVELVGNIYIFNMNDFIENNWINNLYELIILYLKVPDIIDLVSRLLYISSSFFKIDNTNINNNNLLYDDEGNLNKNGYFISSDKYIDIYNKLFDEYIKEKNDSIIFHMILFIANIADGEQVNQENLFLSNTLKYIINTVDIEKDTQKIIDLKIWCIGKFELKDKFPIERDLALKIQKIYIEIFLNQYKFNLFDGLNEYMDENNFFFNFLKLIENSSAYTEVDYIENLLKSNILEFLMDKTIINNENKKMILSILYIFLNLTNAESSLLNRLIKIGIAKFLVNVLSEKTLDKVIYDVCIISINNLLMEPQLWNKVLFDEGVLKTFCVLLKDKNIYPNLFGEICFGIYNVIPFCNKENIIKIIDEFFVIQLVCEAMRNILLNYDSIQKEYYLYFINLIYQLIINIDNDTNLSENISVKFGSVNGDEILDQIINRIIELNISNYTEEENEDLKKILDQIDIIKKFFKRI